MAHQLFHGIQRIVQFLADIVIGIGPGQKLCDLPFRIGKYLRQRIELLLVQLELVLQSPLNPGQQNPGIKGLGKTADLGYVLETGRINLSGSGEELASNEAVKKAYLG